MMAIFYEYRDEDGIPIPGTKTHFQEDSLDALIKYCNSLGGTEGRKTYLHAKLHRFRSESE